MSTDLQLPGGLGLATEDSYLRAIDAQKARPTRAVLTFMIAGESYGLEILHIREIIKMRDITEVPRAPSFLLGVISVRGVVIPVLDVRERLKLDTLPVTRAARILVAVKDREPFGLLVDSVTGVVRFADSEIEPPPSTLVASDVNFISGIGRYASGRKSPMVILLNLDTVLSFDARPGLLSRNGEARRS